jgi:hypothetical protein
MRPNCAAPESEMQHALAPLARAVTRRPRHTTRNMNNNDSPKIPSRSVEKQKTRHCGMVPASASCNMSWRQLSLFRRRQSCAYQAASERLASGYLPLPWYGVACESLSHMWMCMAGPCGACPSEAEERGRSGSIPPSSVFAHQRPPGCCGSRGLARDGQSFAHGLGDQPAD